MEDKSEEKKVEEKPSKYNKKSKLSRPAIIRITVGIIILALAGICTWQFLENQKLRDPSHAATEAKQEAADLKERVAKLMQLPDEEATVATVQDISKLASQDFFKNAQDGDKVLIFTAAKKAIIYRESENKIINSGPIVINSTAATDNTATPAE